MRHTHYIIIAALSVVATSVSAQKAARQAVRAGNDNYAAERYLESEIDYRKALDVCATDSVAKFNLGNALYRQQKADDALQQYLGVAQQADASGNRDFAARAYFNAGDLCMAAQQYDKALELFKQSLRRNPADDEARYNMLLAQKLLKQHEQQNQDQQNQDQQQDQQKQDQQQEQKQQEQQQNQQDNQDQQEQNQQQQQQQQEQKMSAEQAEAILNAADRDDKDTQEKVQQMLMQKVRQRHTDKDW